MFSLLLTLALAQSPCIPGGKGAQCVTCDRSERGVWVCRGVCYYHDPSRKRSDGGTLYSEALKQEDKDEDVAKVKVDREAAEKCK